MNTLDKIIAAVSPVRGQKRAQARMRMRAAEIATMHYDAATAGRRSSSLRASGTDADSAARRRDRVTYISRDMIRNNPVAQRAQAVISANVVGSGIIPKITTNEPTDEGVERPLAKAGLKLIEDCLDTTMIDFEGRQNLYGLQRLAMNTIVDSGEVLIVRSKGHQPECGFDLKLKILEPDYLDAGLDGRGINGNTIFEGIEYDQKGQRVAYHLYNHHPGTSNWRGGRLDLSSTRFPAEDVLHVYRQDRPGQMRGVSWFAPIALMLQDLNDYQDAQLMRQKIAACFVAFRKLSGDASAAPSDIGNTLSPGLIQDIGADEEVTFGTPPDVGGYSDVLVHTLQLIAVGMGISFEALSGNLKQTNFSSGRMGRMEMDRNIDAWQWLMMIPQFLGPLSGWIKSAWGMQRPEQSRAIKNTKFDWVPPYRVLVDPAREIPALANSVRAGFTSRHGVVRQLGIDPERLDDEILRERAWADQHGMIFDSDAGRTSKAGAFNTGLEVGDAEANNQGDDDAE